MGSIYDIFTPIKLKTPSIYLTSESKAMIKKAPTRQIPTNFKVYIMDAKIEFNKFLGLLLTGNCEIIPKDGNKIEAINASELLMKKLYSKWYAKKNITVKKVKVIKHFFIENFMKLNKQNKIADIILSPIKKISVFDAG